VKRIFFHVEAAAKFRPVELMFASEKEVRRIRAWRRMTPMTDAGEFAALAAKRWFYYNREGATVASFRELQAAIRKNSRAEIAFLMIAFAEWSKGNQVLALAYCRRTWCHHFALDFLAVQPAVSFQDEPIRGIGTGMIFGLASLAEHLKIQLLWGEATISSAPFYEKVLQVRSVKDLFIIQQNGVRRLCGRYLARIKQRLAEAEFRKHYY
jgi:hypothetical protein